MCPARGHTSLLTCSKINASQEKVKGPQSTFFPHISAWTTSPWFDFLLPQVPQCSRIRRDLYDVLPDSRAPVESRGVNSSHYRGEENGRKNDLHHAEPVYIVNLPWRGPAGLYFVAFPVGIFGRPCRKSKEENGCVGTARTKERAAGKCRRRGRPRGPCGSRLIKMFPSCLFICSLVAPLPRRLVTRF